MSLTTGVVGIGAGLTAGKNVKNLGTGLKGATLGQNVDCATEKIQSRLKSGAAVGLVSGAGLFAATKLATNPIAADKFEAGVAKAGAKVGEAAKKIAGKIPDSVKTKASSLAAKIKNAIPESAKTKVAEWGGKIAQGCKNNPKAMAIIAGATALAGIAIGANAIHKDGEIQGKHQEKVDHSNGYVA